MKRILIATLIAFVAITISVNAQEIKSLTISPEEAEISVGDSVQFVATVLDSADAVVDTVVVWEIFSLENVGTVDDNGLFSASAAGRGIIIASLGDFADSVSVTVEEVEPTEPVEGAEIVSVNIDEIAVETNVGRTVQLSAVVWDSNDAVVDTTVEWSFASISATIVGTIDDDGLFTATAEGAGVIFASVGDIADSIEVTVAEAREQVAESIEVKPGKHTVAVGDSIEFKAEILDENGDEMEGEVVWSLSDSALGTISEDGLFKALLEGELIVFAAIGEIVGESEITVSNETDGEQVRHNIQVMRQALLGNTTKLGSGKAVEGDTIKITGIPNPFNFMNGTIIYFPEGSLNEDITVTVKIPKIGKIKISEANPLESEVEFPDSIMAGISFEISVNDSVVHPYYFDVPLEVTIPYREALLEKLGITAEEIGMFFITESGELVEEGITDITLDEDNKLIRGVIAHFSDVVLAQKQTVPISVESDMPDGFSLSANYPNPFNPTTTISFSTAELSNVNVTIYNLLGQHVKTLVNEIKPAGTYSVVWNGKNESGETVASGLYFYRFEAGNYIETRKLMMMK